MVKDGNRYNKLFDEETNLFIFRMKLTYVVDPDKEIETKYYSNSFYVEMYDKNFDSVKIHHKAILNELKYPQSMKLTVGDSGTFYMCMLIDKTVGYPYLMLRNAQSNNTWYNLNPKFKQSSVKKIAVKSIKINATEVTLNKGTTTNKDITNKRF